MPAFSNAARCATSRGVEHLNLKDLFFFCVPSFALTGMPKRRQANAIVLR